MSQQYEYTGTIHQIGKTQAFPSGFAKRTLVLVDDPNAQWRNFAAFEFSKNSKQDRTAELDRFRVGQKVKVGFYVTANESRKTPGTWFSGNNAVKIEAAGGNVADLIPEGSPAKANAPDSTEDDDMPF